MVLLQLERPTRDERVRLPRRRLCKVLLVIEAGGGKCGLDLAKETLHRGRFVEALGELCDSYTLLLHTVTMTQGDGAILHRLMVYRHAEGRTDSVLTAVALADGVLLIELAVEVKLQFVVDSTSLVINLWPGFFSVRPG